MSNRHRILVVPEAVTLAHVGRVLALANTLDEHEFEVAMACAPRYRNFFPPNVADIQEIYSIPSEQFLAALATGRPLYDLATLRRYVAEDMRVMERLKPSVVVGDFRLSLAVSARRMKVPYISLCNAYWSPYARPKFELPTHPMAKSIGRNAASLVFHVVRPFAFAYHALPMNRLRREFGLGDWNLDLRHVYTDADYVAYADIPELIPTYDLPSHHSYIGPVLWSPPVSVPSWWPELGGGSPIVYVTMGSSGDAALLPQVIEALAPLPVTMVISSAGTRIPTTLPKNVYCADYLPGDLIAKRAQLVVCNGGSPTTHQALSEGVPVLGITSNMDQFLNMQFVAARGAGLRMRSDELRVDELRAQAQKIIQEKAFHSAAARLADEMRSYDSSARFAAVVRTAAR